MAIEKHDLIFGNVSANDYGIYIEEGETAYNAPTRAVEVIDIPGRNGSLTIDKGHYDNITIEYPCFTYADTQIEFRRKLNAFKNAILSQTGYQRLIDTYQPDEFRLALYIDGLEVVPDTFSMIGDFTLRFNCKPQRFLISGDEKITVTDGASIINPTSYESSPLLLVKGYGTISFNGYDIELTNDTVGDMYVWDYITSVSGPIYSSLSGNTMSFTETQTLTNVSSLGYNDVFNFTLSWTIEGTSDIDTNATVTNTVRYLDSASDTSCTATTTLLSDGLTVSFDIDLNNALVAENQLQIQEFYVTTYVQASSGETMYFTTRVAYGTSNTITFTFTLNNVSSTSMLPTSSSSGNIYFRYVSCEWSRATATSTLSLLGNPTYIDCEIGEAYKYNDSNLVSLNGYIDLGSDLPKLAAGDNEFELDNTIDEVQVVPRTWQL